MLIRWGGAGKTAPPLTEKPADLILAFSPQEFLKDLLNERKIIGIRGEKLLPMRLGKDIAEQLMEADHDPFVLCADQTADSIAGLFFLRLRFNRADDLDSDITGVVQFPADVGFDFHGFQPVPDIAFVGWNDGGADKTGGGVQKKNVAFLHFPEDEAEAFPENRLIICCRMGVEVLLESEVQTVTGTEKVGVRIGVPGDIGIPVFPVDRQTQGFRGFPVCLELVGNTGAVRLVPAGLTGKGKDSMSLRMDEAASGLLSFELDGSFFLFSFYNPP